MKNIDEMNLFDYIMTTFDKICDLTEGRRKALEFYLNNCNGKIVNVSLFKSVFGVERFEDIVSLITDFSRFEELNKFGVLIGEECQKVSQNILDSKQVLGKASQ